MSLSIKDIDWVCNQAHFSISKQKEEAENNIDMSPQERAEELRQLAIDESNLETIHAQLKRTVIQKLN